MDGRLVSHNSLSGEFFEQRVSCAIRRMFSETSTPVNFEPKFSNPCEVLQPVDTWANAELGVEGAVEVRHITKTRIKCDVEDLCRLRCQPHRCFA